MNKAFERSCPRKKNGNCWNFEPHFNNLMDSTNDTLSEVNGSRMDKQSEIRSKKTSLSTFDISTEIFPRLPQSKTQYPLKRYSRTQSETNVGFHTVANSAKLKRVLSATDIRTRLAGCPKGLLIATEPPKSGESYRRRSNTDARPVLGKDGHFRSSYETEYQDNTDSEQEKEMLLLELESAKRERLQLQKENERLQDELENRNKVIDHLIDFMKSSFPEETQSQQVKDDFNQSFTNNNNLRSTHSFEKDNNLSMF